MLKKKKKNIFSNGWFVGISTSIIGSVLFDHFIHTNIFPTIWRFLKNIISAIGDFFGQHISLALWATILLLLALILLTSLIVSVLNSNKKPIVEIRPPYLNYKSDIFDDILYKWDYVKDFTNSTNYFTVNYQSYCPTDNCLLINLHCQICNKAFYYPKTDRQLMVLIKYKIDNNIYQVKP